ncbi:hypothetical protein [Streptomyces glaucescens]|uniref:hypothetical protein n=1 Tax=Streptomyces glaucescens TaxID=1907 RepID=UPI001302BC0C|nr:hypothetical protein [Streptomyces glaucescens]
MGVDSGGDADVGVTEEFLDHDEFDALFESAVGADALADCAWPFSLSAKATKGEPTEIS